MNYVWLEVGALHAWVKFVLVHKFEKGGFK